METEPQDFFAEKALNEKYLILKTQRNKRQKGRDDMRALMAIKALNLADTGRKLNVHKTFRGRTGRLLNVLCTFNLRPVSTGNHVLEGTETQKTKVHARQKGFERRDDT